METRLPFPDHDEVLDSMRYPSFIINSSKYSSRSYKFFENDRSVMLQDLRKLLSHGALGELEKAEIIWKRFPNFLTCRGTIYHPNRTYVEGRDIPFSVNPGRYKYTNQTFYQILLSNSEFEEAEEAGKLMSQEEKQKQRDEVFPDGEIKYYYSTFHRILSVKLEPAIDDIKVGDLVALREDAQLTIYWLQGGKIVNKSFRQDSVPSIVEKLPKVGEESTDIKLIEEIRSQYSCTSRIEEAKKLLQAVFEAVTKDESLNIERDKNYNIMNIIMDDATRDTLDKLYRYAKPKSEHDIGLVFDPDFYYEALNLYDKKRNNFNQKWDRYTFWNVCVEEWLAGCLGTGYLRPHAQGLGNPLSRAGCVLADGSSYFAFRRQDSSFPGHHCFIGYYGGGCVRRRRCGVGVLRVADRYKSYVKQKREQGQTLCSNLHTQKYRHI